MSRSLLIIVLLVLIAGSAFAQDVTALQYLFTVKKVFPDAGEISIFMTPDQESAEKAKIERAAAQTQFKAVIYKINDAREIGENLNRISDNSILLLYPSSVLMDKSSRLFILSKTKDKHISLVTGSPEYTESGALIGIIPNADGRTQLVLNLQHSNFLSSKFTDDFIAGLGAAEVRQ